MMSWLDGSGCYIGPEVWFVSRTGLLGFRFPLGVASFRGHVGGKVVYTGKGPPGWCLHAQGSISFGARTSGGCPLHSDATSGVYFGATSGVSTCLVSGRFSYNCSS